MSNELTNREDVILRAICNLLNVIPEIDVSKVAQAIGVWGGLEEKEQ